MNQPRTHDDAIADVLWWMKGALAFVHSSERSTIQRMHDKLLAMREWQVRLGNEWNRVVRFGRDEKFPAAVIAVTEAELDRIGDALSPQGTAEDREVGFRLVRAILQQVRTEIDGSEDDLPF